MSKRPITTQEQIYTPRIGDWVSVIHKDQLRIGEVISHTSDGSSVRVELYSNRRPAEVIRVQSRRCDYLGDEAPIGVL